VTVNPDIFSDIVAPGLGLAERFDVIVTSWEEGTQDKSMLCEVALSRLGLKSDRAAGLLIDNRADNVAAWQALGGAALHFTGEADFCAEFADRWPLPAERFRG
jgi:hypothetical protein